MSTHSTTPRTPFIAAFYGEGARDFDGRTLDDILSYDNNKLERKHDYIQVLFPLPEGSPFNSQAPIITEATRDAFLESSELRDSLFGACKRMAKFYGFDLKEGEDNYDFVPKANFADLASKTWLMRFGHNHLRITRIIRCLRILGHEELALAFYDALVQKDGGHYLGSTTLMFWERAANRPLHLPPDEKDENAEGISWLRNVVPSG